MFRTRTWVPGCLGGRSRGAWAASPGLLGRLPGAPRGGVPAPNYKGQSPPSTLRIRIKNHVDFDVDIWSLWGRSWGPLGGHFRSCWRLVRPMLVPEPSSNRLIVEKVIVHETLRFPLLFGQNGPQDEAKIDPRTLQDGSKIVLDRLFSPFDFGCDFSSFWDRFWCRFGLPNGTRGAHR